VRLETIGRGEARFSEIAAMREYRGCRDEALALDAQARKTGSAARYLRSAKLIAKCDSALGPEMAGVAAEKRMRAYALSVQNRLKGGDVAGARDSLETLKSAHGGHHLYYPDGTSFTETMELVLGLRDRASAGQFSLANVNGELKADQLVDKGKVLVGKPTPQPRAKPALPAIPEPEPVVAPVTAPVTATPATKAPSPARPSEVAAAPAPKLDPAVARRRAEVLGEDPDSAAKAPRGRAAVHGATRAPHRTPQTRRGHGTLVRREGNQMIRWRGKIARSTLAAPSFSEFDQGPGDQGSGWISKAYRCGPRRPRMGWCGERRTRGIAPSGLPRGAPDGCPEARSCGRSTAVGQTRSSRHDRLPARKPPRRPARNSSR
jgi:hypothetical protein